MKKRILIIALVVALVATCFGGTLAYLKDTHAVKNTFTAGNVYITLDEAKVVKDASGNLVADGNNRVTDAQSYHLFPGMTVVKDPTITMAEKSEDAWVAAKITFTKYNAFEMLTGGVLSGDAKGDATIVESGNVVYVYYNGIKSEKNKMTLFEKLSIPSGLGNDDMNKIAGMEIKVEAFAVQANGFATCQAAMAAAFPDVFPANN